MMIWIIVAGLLACLIILGVKTVNFAFRRRPIPDPSDPQAVNACSWAKYEPYISQGVAWLNSQTVQPLWVESFDGLRLYGRFVPAEGAKATIILFHGYRSSYAVDFSACMAYYHDQGYNLLLVDQRAHGNSQGKYITFGIKERYDVLSWVTYVSLMLGEDHPIFLSGLSMGATTVCMAADLDFPGRVVGIIADCGFTSPWDILARKARSQYHIPGPLAAGFLDFFSSILCRFGLKDCSTGESLAQTTIPVAFFHGLSDQTVPFEMSRQSYDACASKKILTGFPGAHHGTSFLADPARYQAVLEQFMKECLS